MAQPSGHGLANLGESEIDAMVEVMLLAAFADGTLDQSEVSFVKRTLLTVEDLWFSADSLDDRMAKAKSRIESEPRETRLEKLRTQLPWPEQRLSALKLAVRVVAADGIIHESERALISAAAEALGVREDLTRYL